MCDGTLLPVSLVAVLSIACGSRSGLESVEGSARADPSAAGVQALPQPSASTAPNMAVQMSSLDAGAPGRSCTGDWYACVDRTECCSGMCAVSTCYECVRAGEACQADGDCCSEFCVDGYCHCSSKGGPHAFCHDDGDCCASACDPATSECRQQ